MEAYFHSLYRPLKEVLKEVLKVIKRYIKTRAREKGHFFVPQKSGFSLKQKTKIKKVGLQASPFSKK